MHTGRRFRSRCSAPVIMQWMHCEEALEGVRAVPDRNDGREDAEVGVGMKRSCRNVCVCALSGWQGNHYTGGCCRICTMVFEMQELTFRSREGIGTI